ncbi:amidohydrolase family protein [Sphingosinicella sp. CPCC 101087]|uniref:amidohydrolase family protein n=1 Tax=Sphingosinicella sp. CPCC 101087 TaxID=2497754 RepID=UPI00101DB80B|nr:amidohydrolase family protein [Sphingosinicella sp. CPCC 101087]
MAAKFRKIATEEAFSIPEVAESLRDVARSPSQSLDRVLVKGIYDSDTPGKGYDALNFLGGLLDVEERRLAQMDEFGVDMHLLSLTAPGVQMFDADTATDLAALANDRLADICARHPTRFAGLASFAPQSPKRAAKEMERAINELKLNGFILNSHTNDEYLDDPKYWPVLEAAEALGACIYIHPRAASYGFKGPLQDYGLDSAMWGYGMETGTHAVRMMVSGLFDRFPKLTICLGHMGEAIPFWLWRLNFMNSRAQAGGRSPKTELSMEEYFLRNFVITTSGVEDHLALDYAIRKLGADNVLWAIDYPYQPMAPAVEFMESAPVDDETKAKLFHRNAERVFRIAPAEAVQ